MKQLITEPRRIRGGDGIFFQCSRCRKHFKEIIMVSGFGQICSLCNDDIHEVVKD